MKTALAFYDQKSSKKFLAFVLVGGVTAILYFLIFSLLYNYCALSNLQSVSIAYFIAVTFYFIVNRWLTFKAHAEDVRQQLKSYLILLGLNYSITVVLTQGGLAFHLSPYWGLIAALTINMLISYVLCNFWVFRKNSLANK